MSNLVLNTSLLVTRGAVIGALHLANGRSLQRVKTQKNGKSGSLIFGQIAAEPGRDTQQEITQIVHATIAENLPLVALLVDRKLAEQKYGAAMLDENGIPANITELRLVYIFQYVLTACVKAYLPSTGLIKSAPSLSFTYSAEKRTLEVGVKLMDAVDPGDSATPELETPQSLITDINALPDLRDVVSQAAQEVQGSSLAQDDDATQVTPWTVNAGPQGVDYDKLVKRFGCSKISPSLLDRLEKALGRKLHPLLRRNIFYAHRDLEAICEAKERNIPIYIYTGRGPSSDALHLGHLIPFLFCKWMQEALDVPFVIQLTDDEKFLFGQDKSLEDYHRLAIENAKDIISCGLNPEKVFIFSNLDYMNGLYPIALKIQKKTSMNQVRGIFGFTENDNIGKIAFPAVQAAPSFSDCFPGIFGESRRPVRCLIPCAIDQDPYFRLTRDVAPRLGFLKPSLLLSKFIPALQGHKTKMSASAQSTAIFITDSPKIIQEKINKYAFSGGRDTAEEQRQFGANLEVDIAYQYLTFFLEDDQELQQLGEAYESGRMLTGEVKKKLGEVLIKIVGEIQERRAKLTDEDVKAFMNPIRPELQKYYADRECRAA